MAFAQLFEHRPVLPRDHCFVAGNWMVVAFGLRKDCSVAGVGFVALLLVYEHSLVKHDDLSRVNAAFFTMNGLVSMAFSVFHCGRSDAGKVSYRQFPS